jgi:HAD superfamily hydrolase (TIGR01509 family)
MKPETLPSIERSKIKAIIFDMDGVVVDSEPIHERSLRVVAERLGRPMTLAEAKSFKGSTEPASAVLMRDFTGTEVSLEEIMRMRLAIVRELFGEVQLVEGALDFIIKCKDFGWTLALATSAVKEIQETVFAMFGIAPYFAAVVTGNDVMQGKPHPEPYLKTSEKLSLEPGACLVIEDSKFGIISGKAAGCQVTGITTSFPADQLKEAGADLVVGTFTELASFVLPHIRTSKFVLP